MKVLLWMITLCVWQGVNGDIYMHNPRGSNGRGCRNSNDPNRSGNEAQRLFDSQNNDKGGYSCGAAYPFACYKETSAEARAACNARNTELSDADAKAQVDEDGRLKHPEATFTPKMYFYTGSVLPIEWTAQHGAGINAKVHSEIIIQVACEENQPDMFSFTDDCGIDSGTKRCHPRDGTAINNQDEVNTQRIPDDPASQDDYRYGRHESYRYYQFCKAVERNKGLFTADQKLRGNSAQYTRQNPNGNRNGFECPEESEYFPYWHPSPWIDVAIVTSDLDKCERDRQLSQNIVPKNYCSCKDCTGTGQLPNNARHCQEKGGQWVEHSSWSQRYEGVSAPECVLGDFSRDNHLGNVAGNGQPFFFNWTIPDYLAGKEKCVLRVRYNMSSADYDHVSVVGDSRQNGDELSPLLDRDNNPEGVYKAIQGLCSQNSEACKLGLAVNTNQYGRTFQDRSHMFRIKKRPENPECDRIYNLNVRGKRGNIVQVYPAVEYDFVPNVLNATEDDCIHVQWTGSDYNPNRNPNDAEGGPPNPNDIDQSKADRSNLVQMRHERENKMLESAGEFNMFVGDTSLYRKLAFLDQSIEDAKACLDFGTLLELNNNDNTAAERDHRNCMKLSGQETPYFDAGLLKPREGIHKYISTRNNNFSNRGQKGILIVHPSTNDGLSGGAIAGITIGVLIAVAGVGVLGYSRRDKIRGLMTKSKSGGKYNSREAATHSISSQSTHHSEQGLAVRPGPGIPARPSVGTAKVLYDYSGVEAGELTLKVNDIVTVTKKDSSGWWEGRLQDGSTGVFPSNYVQEISGARDLNVI